MERFSTLHILHQVTFLQLLQSTSSAVMRLGSEDIVPSEFLHVPGHMGPQVAARKHQKDDS